MPQAIATRDLWLAAVGSMCVHAGLGGASLLVPVGGPGSVAAALSDGESPVDIDVPDDAELIRLGMEESDADTEAWLGADAETEHAAPMSEVEQAALTLAQGPGSDDAPAAAESATDPARESPATEPPRPEPERVSPADAEAVFRLLRAARDAWEAVADVAEDAALAALNPPASPGEADPGVRASPAPRPSRDAPGGAPGVLSDKEAVAAALRDAPMVVPGRVLAARGLEISTRRPRWSTATLATASPRNPVVRITFGRDGRVISAEFVRTEHAVLSTGYSDVDEPLIHAIYRWTARGEALARVPADDPNAGVTIIVRVMLVG